jgi:hypothetical protein
METEVACYLDIIVRLKVVGRPCTVKDERKATRMRVFDNMMIQRLMVKNVEMTSDSERKGALCAENMDQGRAK